MPSDPEYEDGTLPSCLSAACRPLGEGTQRTYHTILYPQRFVLEPLSWRSPFLTRKHFLRLQVFALLTTFFLLSFFLFYQLSFPPHLTLHVEIARARRTPHYVTEYVVERCSGPLKRGKIFNLSFFFFSLFLSFFLFLHDEEEESSGGSCAGTSTVPCQYFFFPFLPYCRPRRALCPPTDFAQ